MNEQESVEGESAYGSVTSLDSKAPKKKNDLTTQKPSSIERNLCKNHKLREYMILEAVFFLILVFLLITCYRITSQNKETHETILNIQSQLNSFQEPTGNDLMKQIISQNQETHRMILSLQSQLNLVEKHIEKDFINMKKENKKVNENETKKTKAALEDVLKEARMKSSVLLEPIINSTSNSEEAHVQQKTQTGYTNFTPKQYNAATLPAGAWIDRSLSSSSNLNPIFGFDQSSLVLVDRPDPPANKAWCTSDKNPVLTVTLGWYINPTAVSYQHSKWNGTIPDDAPKEYSVEACLDYYCMSRKPLFSHCEYNQHGLQEQICNNISYIDSPVAKLQFRFQKNHGNTERTCVSLVRVYSGVELVPEHKLRRLEDTTTCMNLNHAYHNNPIKYKYFNFKNCALLYSKGCCQECPECCEECEIKDINGDVIGVIIILIITIPPVMALFLYVIYSIIYLCVCSDEEKTR